MRKGDRQGELLFIRVKDLPKVFDIGQIGKVLNTKVIREGELTGHKHEFVGTATLRAQENDYLYDKETRTSFHLPGGTMFLTAEETIEIKHPEHKPLKLEKGNYVVRVQREYDEGRSRLISD